MAYKYKEFDYADYISKNKDKLGQMSNQLQNFDKHFDGAYDYTKDAGWIAADAQLKKDARIAGNNAVGKMGNRIGAVSTAMQTAADSIYADALKNSQALIPQFKEAAYNKAYNNLQNQYNALLQQEQYDYSKYLNDRNFAYDKYIADRNLNYQQYLAQQEQAAAKAQAEADKLKAQLDNYYKYDQLIAEYGPDWLSGSMLYKNAGNQAGNTSDINSSGTKTAVSRTGNTDAFQKIAWTKNNFEKSGGIKQRFGSYENYIAYLIQDALNRGRLNDSEATYLYNFYGIS